MKMLKAIMRWMFGAGMSSEPVFISSLAAYRMNPPSMPEPSARSLAMIEAGVAP